MFSTHCSSQLSFFIFLFKLWLNHEYFNFNILVLQINREIEIAIINDYGFQNSYKPFL